MAAAIYERVVNELPASTATAEACCVVGDWYRRNNEYEKSIQYYQKVADDYSGYKLACVEITRRYWQAVIEQDWQTVAILCPLSTAEEWENKYNGSNFEEIVEIKEPYQEDGCTIVPCTIRFDGNVTRTINMTVIFRTIDGQQSCVIANAWSQDWD